MIVGIFNPSAPATFVQCWDTDANVAQNLVIQRHFPDAESVRQFINRQYRRLEYRSHEPWNEKDHGHRPIYRVPGKFVNFEKPKEIIVPPPLRRNSQLIQRKPFPRKGV